MRVTFDLVNNSAKPLFLPATGVYIDFSARLLSSVAEKNGTERWLNLYGVSDIVPILNVKLLAPGAATHRGYCTRSTVDVVDMGSQLWREIPVRGRLRIIARYYPHDPTQHAPRKKWATTEREVPQSATLILPIPCPDGGCALGCDGPPSVEEGEIQLVPDIPPHEQEWIERGSERNTELRKLFPCSE